MTEAHKGPITEEPKRLSFEDRLSAFWDGVLIGFIVGFVAILFNGHPILPDIALPPFVALIFGAVGFLGGPKLLETLWFIPWF